MVIRDINENINQQSVVSKAGMVQPVVKVDGFEGVDALGTPIRHPEACRRWRFERKEGSPEVGCKVVLLATV